jgi:hypothetical protein
MNVRTPDPGAGAPENRVDHPRPRPSIEERAARRAYVESSGRDRYDGLLRHLRAGREIRPEPRGRIALDWHPVAGQMLLAIVLGVLIYASITWVAAMAREATVDTWEGPAGMVVESGQRLESCPALAVTPNPVFPNWIRYDGAIFGRVDAVIPIGRSNIGTAYVNSGYRLGTLQIYEVHLAGLGPPGSRLLVRNIDAPAGELYRIVPGCS